MGGKMKFEDQAKSHKAIQQYEKKYGVISDRNVKVVGDKSGIFKGTNVEVIVGHGTYGSDLRQINIDWENADFYDYKDFGLYGIYSSVYCKIEYNEGTLTIYGDNGIIIEIN